MLIATRQVNLFFNQFAFYNALPIYKKSCMLNMDKNKRYESSKHQKKKKAITTNYLKLL